MSDPIRSLRNIIKRIEKATERAVSSQELTSVGNFVIDLIVKRTRLGYGVSRQFGAKTSLKPLSMGYRAFRTRNPALSPTTSAGKSNLTFSGQMLDSVKIIRAQNGKVSFGPTGGRQDSSLTNLQVAAIQERQGRIFNRVSQLEYSQALRYYRRQFGDLLKKQRLIT